MITAWAAVHRAGQADPERAHRELQCAAARGMLERARVRLTRRCAQQDRKVACRVQSRTSPFEPRQPDPGGVRGKTSDELRPSRAPLGQRQNRNWPTRCNALRPRIRNLTVFGRPGRPQIMKGGLEKPWRKMNQKAADAKL